MPDSPSGPGVTGRFLRVCVWGLPPSPVLNLGEKRPEGETPPKKTLPAPPALGLRPQVRGCSALSLRGAPHPLTNPGICEVIIPHYGLDFNLL